MRLAGVQALTIAAGAMAMDFGSVFVATAWVLIPLSAIAIPLAAVVGKLIVRPITQAITRLADAERDALAAGADRRFADLDTRLAGIERQLGRALDGEIRRQLDSGPVATGLAAPVGSAERSRLAEPPRSNR